MHERERERERGRERERERESEREERGREGEREKTLGEEIYRSSVPVPCKHYVDMELVHVHSSHFQCEMC